MKRRSGLWRGYKLIANHISYCRLYLSHGHAVGKYDTLHSPLARCAQHGLMIAQNIFKVMVIPFCHSHPTIQIAAKPHRLP